MILAEDPKFCHESKVSSEQITIALEEGKVKRIWEEMARVPLEEGESPPTEEELQADKELEDEGRRIFDFELKSWTTSANGVQSHG